MDIEYLLLLQRLRETAGGLLTPLMELVSELAASSVTIGAAAFVFWAVDRQFGGFLMLNYVGSSLLNQAVKLTACVYRPWVRDGRVQPVLTALDKATGYSFPSGHTQSAAAIYGSVALWYGKKRPWLAGLMAVMILLTGFSRNYLGVHTPQDVLVSMALCAGYLWLNGKVAALLEKRPGLEAQMAVRPGGGGPRPHAGDLPAAARRPGGSDRPAVGRVHQLRAAGLLRHGPGARPHLPHPAPPRLTARAPRTGGFFLPACVLLETGGRRAQKNAKSGLTTGPRAGIIANVPAVSRRRKGRYGPVAQLVRAPACHAGGRRFEPDPGRHLLL